jgi:hypothetical protein
MVCPVVHANIAPGSGIIAPAGKALGKVKFFFGNGQDLLVTILLLSLTFPSSSYRHSG